MLDLNKKDGIVDLSLLPDLLELSRQAAAAGGQQAQQQHKKKKRKTDKGAAAAAVVAELEQGQEVECTVQLVGVGGGVQGAVHGCGLGVG